MLTQLRSASANALLICSLLIFATLKSVAAGDHCTETDQKESAVISVLTISGPNTLCPGVPATYTAKTLSPVNCTFQWSVVSSTGTALRFQSTDKNVPFVVNLDVAPQAGTTVTVKCTLTFNIGCLAHTTEQITAKVAPEPSIIIGPNQMTWGQTGTFTTTPTCAGPSTLRWNVPSGWLINGQPGPLVTSSTSVSIKAPSSGTSGQISVQTWYPNNSVTGGFPRTLMIYLGQFLPLSMTISGTEYVTRGQSTTWTANPSGGTGTYSYQWQYNVNGSWTNDYSNLRTFTYTLTTQREIRLRCTVTSGSATAYDEHAAYCAQCGPSLAAYPNPASETMILENQDDEIINVEVYNIQGRRVKAVDNIRSKTNLDTSDLPAGRYTLKIITPSGTTTENILIDHGK